MSYVLDIRRGFVAHDVGKYRNRSADLTIRMHLIDYTVSSVDIIRLYIRAQEKTAGLHHAKIVYQFLEVITDYFRGPSATR